MSGVQPHDHSHGDPHDHAHGHSRGADGARRLRLALLIAGSGLHPAAETSLNLRGAYLEVVSDALASLGVVVAAVVMKTTGWLYADALVSIVIGLAILPRTWQLLKEALGVLLEGVPDDVN